jgi:copper transport protein
MFSRAAGMLRLLAVVVGTALAVLLFPTVAYAHTEFEGSDPEDGATVDGPLEVIVLSFTNPAVLSGDGIVLLDAEGAEVEATLEEDETEFTLVPATPLAEGTFGVRWEVRAGDAHPIDGTLTFTVVAAEPTATPSEAATGPSPTATPTETPPTALDEALEGQGGGWVDPTRFVSRFLVVTGAMVALGGLAVLSAIVRGRPEELRAVLGWVRIAGGVVAAGGVLRLLVLAGSMPSPGDVVESSLGTASILRAVGGLALVLGLSLGTDGNDTGRARHASSASSGRHWRGWGRSVVGLVGAGMVLVAFWFDGHTASRGPWPLHAAVNTVHVAAAAVWSGGLIVLTALVWRRHRSATPQDGAWLVAGFSRLATVSLVAVVLAGAGLAVLVLDSLDELWTSPWGRVLLAKMALVAVVAALGAAVHLRLRPALQREPQDPSLAGRVRRSFSAEAVAFVGVLALTAWLVGAAT